MIENICGVEYKVAPLGGSNGIECSTSIPCGHCRKVSQTLIHYRAHWGEVVLCFRDKCFKSFWSTAKFEEWESIDCRLITCPTQQAVRQVRRDERAKVNYRIRWNVISRDNFRCVACGSNEKLQVDHIVPVSRGGKSTIDNLQTLCWVCNSGKGNS